MPHRRCVGKLEGKLFRNYCYMHSEKVPIDRKDPDSPTETVFVGTLEEARQAVLAEAREERTGDISTCAWVRIPPSALRFSAAIFFDNVFTRS